MMRLRSAFIPLFLGVFFVYGATPPGAAGEDLQATLENGRAALKAGQAAEAVKIFSSLISAGAQADLYYYRGLAYSAQDMQGSALKDFNEAVTLDSNKSAYFLARGISLYRIEQYQDAADDFTIAANLDSNNVRALTYRGRAFLGLRQYERALDDLSQAIRQSPRSARLYRLQGDILSASAKFKEAIDSYDKAIKLDPNYAAAYNNRGCALAHVGKTKEGLEDLLTAMSVASSSSVPDEASRGGLANPW